MTKGPQGIIEAVPESGELQTGVEKIVYVLTAYPDGRAAHCAIEVQGQYGQATLKAASRAWPNGAMPR